MKFVNFLTKCLLVLLSLIVMTLASSYTGIVKAQGTFECEWTQIEGQWICDLAYPDNCDRTAPDCYLPFAGYCAAFTSQGQAVCEQQIGTCMPTTCPNQTCQCGGDTFNGCYVLPSEDNCDNSQGYYASCTYGATCGCECQSVSGCVVEVSPNAIIPGQDATVTLNNAQSFPYDINIIGGDCFFPPTTDDSTFTISCNLIGDDYTIEAASAINADDVCISANFDVVYADCYGETGNEPGFCTNVTAECVAPDGFDGVGGCPGGFGPDPLCCVYNFLLEPQPGVTRTPTVTPFYGNSLLDLDSLYDSLGWNFGRRPPIGLIISSLLTYIFPAGGLLLLLFLLYGGFTFMTSAGDPGKAQQARALITYALVGFAVIFTAYWITQALSVILGLGAFGGIFN